MNTFISPFDYGTHALQQQAERTVAKPVVKYQGYDAENPPQVGGRYGVVPLDHPASYLNGRWATTSTIVAVDGKNFETLNTRYESADEVPPSQ